MNHRAPETFVLAAFAATLLLAAYQMVSSASAHARRTQAGYGAALSCGLSLGVATGFFGVGGGFLIVPALTLCLGLDVKAAVATSLAVIALNSLGGLVAYAALGAVQWRLGLGFTAAALLGGALAFPVAGRLSGAAVQQVFAALLGIVGVGMLARTVWVFVV